MLSKTDTVDFSHLDKVLDQIPVGITVIDFDGRILYYNQHSSQIVNRKPEYIGKDFQQCHNISKNVSQLSRVLREFKTGKIKEFNYESSLSGKCLIGTLTPLKVDGIVIACIQTLVVKK